MAIYVFCSSSSRQPGFAARKGRAGQQTKVRLFFYYPFSGGYFHTGFLAVAQSGLPKKPGSPPAATRKKGEKAVGRCWTQRTGIP